MSKDFTHGWNSSGYIFRIEVDGRMEHEYTFSIDGVAFVQMPRKNEMEFMKNPSRDTERRNSSGNSSAGKSKAPFAKAGSGAKSQDRRFSGETGTETNRGSFQSPDVNKNAFDPFESDEPADPFNEDPFGSAPSDAGGRTKRPPAQLSPIKAPVVQAPPVSLLDNDDEQPAQQNSFAFGTSTAPASFDPFGTATEPFVPPRVNRNAADISNDFAGMSFSLPVKEPEHSVPINPFATPAHSTADDFFDEEPLPPAPVAVVPEVWSAPKNLVNLDLNAPSASSTTNAFSGRSPSLNLLLNGSATRPTGQTGMNAPPQAQMGTNGPQGMNGPQGGMNGPQGMNGHQGGMNGPQGMVPYGMGPQGMNGPQGGMNGPYGMNGPQGMNHGMGGHGQMMGMGMGMNGGQNMGPGVGMMQQQQIPQQQQMQQQQQFNQGGMMQQGQGMQQRPQGPQGLTPSMGMAGGVGSPNSRLMMGGMPGGGGMQGQGQGQQGQGQIVYGMPVNMPSTSGATSSLTGVGLARGVPSQNGPKSSLDSINWKM